MFFLRTILDLLFPPRDTEALVRTLTLPELGNHVRPTVRDGITSLMPYREAPVRALILEAKFRGNPHAEELLGRVLNEYLVSWLSERAEHETTDVVLVPIPLSQERLKERGYNQTERIASRALEGASGIRLEQTLRRCRHTAPQTSLGGRERRANMVGAFATTLPTSPACTYIVFDDVSTTGATLKSATQALKSAGTQDVIPLSLAH